MPNWVQNYVKIDAKGKQLEDILQAIRRDGDARGSFDFNKLIPMPEALNLTSGSITTDAIEAYISHLNAQDINAMKTHSADFIAASKICASRWSAPDFHMSEGKIAATAQTHDMTASGFIALGKQYVDNQKEYGAPTWYEWRVRNWGTKWNLEEGSVIDWNDDKSLAFQTAWTAPEPILKALSEKFPAVTFVHRWADEDLGQNVGEVTYLGGKVIDSGIPEPGTARAYEMAADIWDEDLADRGLRYDPKNDTYVYEDELEEEEELEHPSLNEQVSSAASRETVPTPTNTPDLAKRTGR